MFVRIVEPGVGRRTVAALLNQVPLRTSSPPFADYAPRGAVLWVEPRIEAEVTYSEVMQVRLLDPAAPRRDLP